MASLTVRNIPDDTFAAFRVRAASHGRSMEAEVRELIVEATGRVEAPLSVEERVAKAQAIVRKAFGGELPKGMVDELIADRRAEAAKERSW